MQELIDKNVANLERGLAKYNVSQNDVNPNIYEVLDYPHFPSAPIDVVILNACYKRFAPIGYLSTISNQYASSIRNLKERGFIIQGTGRNKVVIENGVRGRLITGFDYDLAPAYFPNIKTKYKNQICNGNMDPFTGSKNNLQIDHRIPQKAQDEKGLFVPDLTDKLYEQELALDYYQPCTHNTNDRKREECIKCMDGNPITVPPALEYNNNYITYFDELYGCNGCVWFDWRFDIDTLIYDWGM